jgi:hypothetical protein
VCLYALYIILARNLEKFMKNKSLRYLAIAVASSMTALLTLELAITAPAAEAACRVVGRSGGVRLLKCTGRTRCRATGRYTKVNGRRLPLVVCPR